MCTSALTNPTRGGVASPLLQDAFSPFSAQGRQKRFAESYGGTAPPTPAPEVPDIPDFASEFNPESLDMPEAPAAAAATAAAGATAASASKFEQQLSGEWNNAVLEGKGPWGEGDMESFAKGVESGEKQSMDEVGPSAGEGGGKGEGGRVGGRGRGVVGSQNQSNQPSDQPTSKSIIQSPLHLFTGHG